MVSVSHDGEIIIIFDEADRRVRYLGYGDLAAFLAQREAVKSLTAFCSICSVFPRPLDDVYLGLCDSVRAFRNSQFISGVSPSKGRVADAAGRQLRTLGFASVLNRGSQPVLCSLKASCLIIASRQFFGRYPL